MAEQLDISAPLKLFYSYAREDESFRDEMSKAVQLVKRQGLIEETYDGDVHGGMNWGHEIRSKLESADVIALLVSPDFIASDYCYGKEMPRALERSSRGEATVVPIILRPTDLTDAPFNHLQYLPKNKLPVSMWTDRESAYQDIAVGVRTIVGRIKHRRAETVQALNPDTDAVEDRVLDAAVAGEIPVDEAREVAIQVRLAASEGLRLCIKEDLLRGDTGRSYSAYPDDVRSSQLFSIPWSRKGLLQGDMDLSLRLSPSDIVVGQPEKNIKVAAIRDSGVFTFLIKACLEGTYYLNAELLCGDTSLAERMLRTKAKTHNLPPSGPGLVGQSVVASVPLAVRAVVKAAFA